MINWFKFGLKPKQNFWIWTYFQQILTFLLSFSTYFIIFDWFRQFQSFNRHLDDHFWSFNQKSIQDWTILFEKLSILVGFWHRRLIKIRFQRLNRCLIIVRIRTSKFVLWLRFDAGPLIALAYWNHNFCSNLIQYLKTELFGNLIVIERLKSILVWISDTFCTYSGMPKSERPKSE